MIVNRMTGLPISDVQQRLLAHWHRFLRFGLVGGLGVVVNTLILSFLVGEGGWNHLAAAGVATELTILFNFVLNDSWTFRGTKAAAVWGWRAARYNAVGFGGLLLSLGVMGVLTLGFGIHYLIANLIAIAAVTAWNYALNLHFTWAGPSVAEPQMWPQHMAEATALEER